MIECRLAPPAALAIDYDLLVFGLELTHALVEMLKGHVDSSGQVPVGVFERGAYVNQSGASFDEPVGFGR